MASLASLLNSSHIPTFRNRERGAAILMVYVSILLFLFFAILTLDVPYMERTGRSLQSVVDAASVAGAVTLTGRNATLGWSNEVAWRNAKRAVFAVLENSKILGAEDLVLEPVTGSTSNGYSGTDHYETGFNPDFAYTNYWYPAGNATNPRVKLTIHRGIYQAPTAWPPGNLFWSLETGEPARGTGDTCIAAQGPAVCATSPLAINVADSVQVTITLSNVPTLFAKIFGMNSYTETTRTATAGPGA